MQSWMMKLWLNDHDRSEWPERPIYQPEDACHVTRAEEHPSKEVIEAMCSEGFFTHHKYQYVENIRGSESDEVDNEQYEYYELPDQSPLDLPPQSPQEGLSTGSVSPDHSSKFVEGDVTDRTCNAERQLQETTNYSNQMTSSHEQKAEQDSFFTETSNSINFYQAEEEPYEYCYDYCRGDDDDDEEEEEEEQEEEGEEEEEEEEEEEDKEEPYSSANANEKSREDARRVEVGKNGFKSNISLDNDTAYTELDTSSKGYMPLAKEQWKAQEPCCINLENEVFKTKVAQCSSNNSADESYMCVDLLVQGLHQGQEDERPLTEPVNSDQNYHSHEDMAIQALLKSAECLYHDIVQKMKKSTESRV